MSEIPFREKGRRTPAKGVHVSFSGPNWVLLTICTKKVPMAQNQFTDVGAKIFSILAKECVLQVEIERARKND